MKNCSMMMYAVAIIKVHHVFCVQDLIMIPVLLKMSLSDCGHCTHNLSCRLCGFPLNTCFTFISHVSCKVKRSQSFTC